MRCLSGCAIPFCLLVFLLTVRPLCCRSVGVYWRSTPDPVCLGITRWGLQNSKDCCLFFPLEASSQGGTCQMPARVLLYEVSIIPYWDMSPSQDTWVRDPLEEEFWPLAELGRCAGRSVALFRAIRQGHLSLLKLCPQPSLPPGALSQGDGSFICKSLTGAAVFFFRDALSRKEKSGILAVTALLSCSGLHQVQTSRRLPNYLCLHCEGNTAP
uniref:Uncharacterized protein n=1 Tax=Papio anubis TaxID=9555 RepID=A0A8I5N0E8_PAPAN